MGKSPFLIGKPSISMGDFPWRTVSHNQRVPIGAAMSVMGVVGSERDSQFGEYILNIIYYI